MVRNFSRILRGGQRAVDIPGLFPDNELIDQRTLISMETIAFHLRKVAITLIGANRIERDYLAFYLLLHFCNTNSPAISRRRRFHANSRTLDYTTSRSQI